MFAVSAVRIARGKVFAGIALEDFSEKQVTRQEKREIGSRNIIPIGIIVIQSFPVTFRIS